MKKTILQGPLSPAVRLKTALPFFALIGLLKGVLFLSGCTGTAQQTSTQPTSQISVVPSSITFTNVVIGQKSSQTVQITNTGQATLNVTGVTLTGSGFSLSAVSVPFQLAPGASKTVTITFTAASTTSVTGTLSITSDAPTSPMTVAVQGTGTASSASWQMAPTSLSFGTIALQTTQTLPATITNTGNVSVTLGSVTISNQEWSSTGLSAGTTLSPGQQLPFNVAFSPTVAGNATGTLQVSASNVSSVLTMNLSGAGASGTQHSVTLNWTASPSSISGYHIYRGTVSGGPYTLLNPTLNSGVSYVDSTVASGGQYFYVATAVDSSGLESPFSNEASATIPTP